jgi:hypothetical protein
MMPVTPDSVSVSPTADPSHDVIEYRIPATTESPAMITRPSSR